MCVCVCVFICIYIYMHGCMCLCMDVDVRVCVYGAACVSGSERVHVTHGQKSSSDIAFLPHSCHPSTLHI